MTIDSINRDNLFISALLGQIFRGIIYRELVAGAMFKLFIKALK